MRTSRSAVLLSLGALAAAGTAIAATPETHLLNVALPDGSVARIEYQGNVAPKVTIVPSRPTPLATAPFAMFDQISAMIERQRRAMLRQIDALAKRPLGGGSSANLASNGNLPAGTTSYSVVTTTNGATSCTRTVEITSLGAGKPPKVVSSTSGQCAADTKPLPAPAKPSAPAVSQQPLNRT